MVGPSEKPIIGPNTPPSSRKNRSRRMRRTNWRRSSILFFQEIYYETQKNATHSTLHLCIVIVHHYISVLHLSREFNIFTLHSSIRYHTIISPSVKSQVIFYCVSCMPIYWIKMRLFSQFVINMRIVIVHHSNKLRKVYSVSHQIQCFSCSFSHISFFYILK